MYWLSNRVNPEELAFKTEEWKKEAEGVKKMRQRIILKVAKDRVLLKKVYPWFFKPNSPLRFG